MVRMLLKIVLTVHHCWWTKPVNKSSIAIGKSVPKISLNIAWTRFDKKLSENCVKTSPNSLKIFYGVYELKN